MKIFAKLIVVCILVTLLFSACTPPITPQPSVEAATSQPTQTEPPSPTDSPAPPTDTSVPTAENQDPPASPTPLAFGPDKFPANVDPLTGQILGDTALLERRPVATKIQIFPRGQRPTWGLNNADIVFDFYQNNGLTRLHTIFYGKDTATVGPIRSARLLDVDLIKMYKSIFAFGGAEYRTRTRLFNADFADRLVVEGYNMCPPLCRVDPNGYNYLVANTAELSKYADQKGIDNSRQNLDGMSFSEIAPDGMQADQIFVRFSISAYSRWDYELANNRYLRFQDTTEAYDVASEVYDAFTDRDTGAQIAADNVIVLIVPHEFAFGTSPGPGEVVDMRLTGSGKAYAFRDGRVYQVTWNRPSNTSVISLAFPDGSPYPFKPGNTWFEIIGQSSKVEQPGQDVWRFMFQIP
jgi:hypothetical protein